MNLTEQIDYLILTEMDTVECFKWFYERNLHQQELFFDVLLKRLEKNSLIQFLESNKWENLEDGTHLCIKYGDLDFKLADEYCKKYNEGFVQEEATFLFWDRKERELDILIDFIKEKFDKKPVSAFEGIKKRTLIENSNGLNIKPTFRNKTKILNLCKQLKEAEEIDKETKPMDFYNCFDVGSKLIKGHKIKWNGSLQDFGLLIYFMLDENRGMYCKQIIDLEMFIYKNKKTNLYKPIPSYFKSVVKKAEKGINENNRNFINSQVYIICASIFY